MVSPLNVAILGAGIGQEHLRAYGNLEDLYIVTHLCDIDRKRAEQVLRDENKRKKPIELVTETKAVFENSDVDIVDICLPPHLHYPVSVEALTAGKHVICEKPLTGSLREADQLKAIAASSNRSIFPVFQYRFGPAIRNLNALVERGFAGKPLIASIETHWNRNSDYYANPWRGTWKGEQGGAVLGHAIHNHDLLCAIMGPVKSLSAFGATRVNPIETEDCASISFLMENGALATSSVTLGSYTNTTRLKFCFENLTVESDLLPYAPASGKWSFDVRGAKGAQDEVDAFLATLPDVQNGFTGFLEAVAHDLATGEHTGVHLEDGRRSIELVTAIYDSIRSGNRVDLPLDSSHRYYEGWLSDA